MIGRVEQAEAFPATVEDSIGGGEHARTPSSAPVAQVMALAHILGRKWTPRIMIALRFGPLSHGALSRQLSGVQRKVMQESLDRLLADALVKRIVDKNDLGRSTTLYGLTIFGDALLPLLDQMSDWCDEHFIDLTAAQKDGPEIVVVSASSADGW